MSSIEPGLNIQFNTVTVNMTANIYQGFCNICIHVHTQLRSLTNEESRKNWETYGNPDGPRGEDHNLLEINITSLLFIIIIITFFLGLVTSFGIALPAWIVDQKNSMLVIFFSW